MKQGKILVLVGDPVGGIRRHVHTLLSYGLCDVFDVHYGWSTLNTDAVFKSEIDQIRPLLAGVLPLIVMKKPTIHDIGNFIKIISYVRKKHIQVIHAHGAKAGLYARIAGVCTGARVVYTPHGGAVHNMFGKLMGSLIRITERFLYRFTDLLIFESQYSKAAYERVIGVLPKDKFRINYNGVTIPEELPSIRHLDGVGISKIGVVGMLRHEKGIDIALRAFAELPDTVARELHIFGEGPDRDSLQKLAHWLGIKSRVFFWGDVRDMPRRYSDLDLVLIPSRFESFGYVAVEAGIAGVPVAAAAAGGLLEIIRDRVSGRLFPVNDWHAAATAIREMAEHPEVTQKMALSAQIDCMNRFRQDKMVSNVCSYIKELLE